MLFGNSSHIQRRRFLRAGIVTAALMALVGGGVSLVRPAFVKGRLTPTGSVVITAIARAVLDASLDASASARNNQLRGHLQRVDATLSGFPAGTQAELSRLLTLLSTAPGRRFLVGLTPEWADASTAEIQRCMQAMRLSSSTLRQQAYHGLRDLTNAAFYSDTTAWHLMGYPGPSAV
jgi:hypothetical protein